MVGESVCQNCAAKTPKAGTGRPRKWCSKACSRQGAKLPQAARFRACQGCGGAFRSARGNKNFCSQKCVQRTFIRDRESTQRRAKRLAKSREYSKNRHVPTAYAKRCAHCDCDFTAARSDTKYCSPTCSRRAYNKARTADGRLQALREKLRDYNRAYGRAHYHTPVGKAQHRAADSRRRARLAGVEVNDFTAAHWDELLAEHSHSCAYCGVTGVPLERDHVIALSKGGPHTKSNIVPACRACNGSKNARDLDEWLADTGRTLTIAA